VTVWLFVHAGGTFRERDLKAGEVLKVDTGCLAALAPTVDCDIQFVGGIRNALLGGEGRTEVEGEFDLAQMNVSHFPHYNSQGHRWKQ
jgi:uncharacterized protein (AIM24 family)